MREWQVVHYVIETNMCHFIIGHIFHFKFISPSLQIIILSSALSLQCYLLSLFLGSPKTTTAILSTSIIGDHHLQWKNQSHFSYYSSHELPNELVEILFQTTPPSTYVPIKIMKLDFDLFTQKINLSEFFLLLFLFLQET